MKRIALLLAAIAVHSGVALASVDVNTATKEELEAEGIGSTAAQAIVDHRTRNGPFKSSDEVRKVISDAIAAKMTVGISISGPATAKPPAPKESSAEVKAKPGPQAKSTPVPEAKAPAPVAGETSSPSTGSKDDQKIDNVRERAKKDQDDRKT